MKLLHLADLHLGKRVNDISMIKEQRNVLSSAVELIKKEQIDAVLIAGDVFDKPIPTIEALELFSNFLSELLKINQKVFIISGNHDNLERLSYLSDLLEKTNIFFSKSFNGKLQKISLNDDIEIYLMPYLYPALIRKYFPEANINNYNDAIKAIIDNTILDENKINILVAHQFVCGVDEECILSQSEEKSVGGVDIISSKLFEKFDYTALGHLHCPQKAGNEKIRYAGSLIKYSFSEINQNKAFTIVDVKSKNDIKINLQKVSQLHEMKEYKGFIDEFLDKDFYSKIKTDDYIHFILKDEEVIDAKKKLSTIYENIMILEFDNSFTRKLNSNFSFKDTKEKSLLEHFIDFYSLQSDSEIDENKIKLLENIINEEKN